METLSDAAVIRQLLQRHGFSFAKSLGQNFLVNPDVCPRMAALCGVDGESGVLEIGPGIGVLTQELAKKAKKVVCVELDGRLLPILRETLRDFDNVTVLQDDILKIDLVSLMETQFSGMRTVVCANLPYYITSPVILRLLQSKVPFDTVTVMVQKEVADRICAFPGSKFSGAITVLVDYYAEAEKLFSVSKGSFLPAPKVDSAVIRLTKRKKPCVEVENAEAFFSFVKAAFSMRRKTVVNSLSGTLHCPKEKVLQTLRQCGLPADVRAEALTTQQLGALFSAMQEEG